MCSISSKLWCWLIQTGAGVVEIKAQDYSLHEGLQCVHRGLHNFAFFLGRLHDARGLKDDGPVLHTLSRVCCWDLQYTWKVCSLIILTNEP